MLAEKQGLGGEHFDSGLRNLRKPRQHHPDLSKTHLPIYPSSQVLLSPIFYHHRKGYRTASTKS